MSRPVATGTLVTENAQVRVTRYDIEPGAETGWHRHGHDYVIVPVTACTLTLEEPGGGVRTVTFPPGGAYARQAGVEHNVINGGDAPMTFVEVELLDRKG